jgi:thiamine pyrophosphate-dependent acetolactate synthase large subunit-like protein
VPHEIPAVAMAHGYAMVTGRPQVVMVHVTVGTAHGLAGIMNAARSQVPMVLWGFQFKSITALGPILGPFAWPKSHRARAKR